MLKRLVPALVAVALLAGGCSAETIPESERIRVESSSSPLGPGSDFDKQRDKDAKAEKKSKKKTRNKANLVTAERAGVRVKVPAGWSPLSAKDLSFAADSPRGQEISQRTGLTLEQLRQRFETIDLYFLGYSGVLTVGAIGTNGRVPTRSEFEAQIGDLGGVDSVSDVTTPLGTGQVFDFTLTVGGVEQYGSSLYVLNGSTVVEITSGGADPAGTRAVLDRVTRSLKRA